MISPAASAGPTKLASIIYCAIAVLVAVYAVVALVVAPAMYPDSAWGFVIWESMARGGPFNHIVEPALDDISRDTSAFNAIWSPGQYLVPVAIQLLGLKLGPALVIVTTVFTVLGLVGWQAVYRAWDFPPLTVAIAVALTACTRAVALPFGIYNGGEVLLFGTAPWFLLLLVRWRTLTVVQSFGIVTAMAIVVFMKLSGALIVYAALAASVVYDVLPPSMSRLRRPIMATLIAIVFAVGFYFLWLSKGGTAATGYNGGGNAVVWADVIPRFLQGWAATVFGMLSLGDFARRLFQHPAQPVLASLDQLHLVASIPALALMAWMCRRLWAGHADYVRFALATAVFYILAITLMYSSGGDIRMQERYFRPLSLVLLVGVVHAAATSRGMVRLPLAAVAAAAAVYGVASYFVHVQQNLQYPMSAQGFRHQYLTNDAMALLKNEIAGSFDRKDTVVWLIDAPEAQLELPRARIIPSETAPDQLALRSYNGRVGKLFILVPAKMVADGSAAALLKQFRDYDPARWLVTTLGDATLYSQ
jgi:hypothetical protein